VNFKKLVFNIKDKFSGYEFSDSFIERLRNECDWGSVDKTSESYIRVFEEKPEIHDLIDFFESIDGDMEYYSDDTYQVYMDYIAGVVDYYDMLSGEEIVFDQD